MTEGDDDMPLTVNVVFPQLDALLGVTSTVDRIESKLDALSSRVNSIAEEQIRMAAGAQTTQARIDALKAEVERNTNVQSSAVTLINGIAQQLRDALANNDTAAIEQLTAQLQTSTSALAAAVVANTTSQPPPPPTQP